MLILNPRRTRRRYDIRDQRRETHSDRARIPLISPTDTRKGEAAANSPLVLTERPSAPVVLAMKAWASRKGEAAAQAR